MKINYLLYIPLANELENVKQIQGQMRKLGRKSFTGLSDTPPAPGGFSAWWASEGPL